MPDNSPESGQGLCKACGFCCDGTLFKHVELSEHDAAKRQSTISIKIYKGKQTIPQPCPAHNPADGCVVYADRPGNCRKFHCRLLKRFQSGKISKSRALEKILMTREVRQEVVTIINSKASFLKPLPLSEQFRLLFHDDNPAARSSAFRRQDARSYLAYASLVKLLQKYFFLNNNDAK